MKLSSIKEFFISLRFNEKFHLGLGDIRLTLAMQEKIIDKIEKLEQEIKRLKSRI